MLYLCVCVQANALFGQVVLSAYKPGDMVWVQDYHLMLLPSILKQTVPRMKVTHTQLCLCPHNTHSELHSIPHFAFAYMDKMQRWHCAEVAPILHCKLGSSRTVHVLQATHACIEPCHAYSFACQTVPDGCMLIRTASAARIQLF